MDGSIVNQIEISGFSDAKESARMRKKLKTLKSVFNLSAVDKKIGFTAQEASWKEKDDHSLVYLFLTEDSFPREEVRMFAELFGNLEIQHLAISPSGCGEMIHLVYSAGEVSETSYGGSVVHMLGDLIKGGFQ